MPVIANILVGLVAVLHIGFFVGEFFLWEKIGPGLLNIKPDQLLSAKSVQLIEGTKVLASNMAIYNLFLAAGLLWALFIVGKANKVSIVLFFLGFIVLAGLYGWYSTGSVKLLMAQSVPAIIAFGAVYLRGLGAN